MKTSFNINGINFAMSAKYMGIVSNIWDGDKNSHNSFYVTITTDKGRTSFKFYDSFANYAKGVTELDDEALKGAFECFLSDGTCYSGSLDFGDFCAEFGYNDMRQYKKALNVWNSCKRHHLAAVRLFGENYGELLNALYD